MVLSKRAKMISPSPTLAIDAKAKSMKSQGINVLNFGVGEPDFDTPDNIKEAAIGAIKRGITKYTAVAGTDSLKQAIVDKLKKDNGLSYSLQEIVVSSGAKHSLYNAFQVIVDEGDEVILPAPYWVSYEEQIKLAGGNPVIVEGKEENGFKITEEQLRKAINSKTKAIILNTPSNPTGAVYSRSELEALGRVIEETGIMVVSDEIYEKLLYDGSEHVSIASLSPKLKELTIVINGVSKAYSMTGWRIGYAAARKEIVQAMTSLQSHSTSNPTSIAQEASIEALAGTQEPVEEMLRSFSDRREYMLKRLQGIEGVTCNRPGGAFYLYPNFSALFGKQYNGQAVNDSNELANLLLEEAKLAFVPGEAFGTKGNLRISYATSMENIREGMDRLEAFLNKLT